MKDETKTWVSYAEENLESAIILLAGHLYNPCLQNVQQAVEKALKAILIERVGKLQRTHDILELKYLLNDKGIKIDISDESCDFLNSIYLPSKYPIGSALADFEPDAEVCRQALQIAEAAVESVRHFLSHSADQ